MSSSVVEYFGASNGHKCGYCRTDTNNSSHGKFSETFRNISAHFINTTSTNDFFLAQECGRT